MYNNENTVEFLIAVGSEVDRENNNGVTPLMAAARDGYTNVVVMLLNAGANVAQVDEFGRTVRLALQHLHSHYMTADLCRWVPRRLTQSQTRKAFPRLRQR
jgi:hypothetical protein